MAYEQPSVHYTDPGTQVPRDNGYSGSQPRKQRPHSQSYAQEGSAMPQQNHYTPPQKVDEAVTSAFDRAGAETQNYVPPELIAQITQNVIKQLQSGGLDGTTPVNPQNSFSPPPPPIQQPVPLSPSTASGTSTNMPNRVLTPPSPQKHQDYPNHSSPESHTRFTMPDGPPSPTQSRAATFSPPRRTSSPQSQASNAGEKPARPKGPSRLSTSKEETTLERIWGQLFDEEGHPTVRLGQFLRGLAVHIIEDYEPRQSIVITPSKMQKYYEEVKLANEKYPWSSKVFDHERSSISRMYRDLSCQHHLVQERYDERPDIPGLTPVGFERWVTLLIQAHPEEEFERLQKAVLEMPISNPDDKKERFPKEISRRLFPGHGDTSIRDRIEDSISEHAAVDLPRRSSRDEPRNHQDSPPQKSAPTMDHPPAPQNHRASVSSNLPSTTTNSESTYVPSNLERERKPYSNIPSECAIDDTNPPMPMPPPTTTPIERERKPYSVMPGGGKQYEDENRPKDLSKPRSESNAPKPSRSDSTARARPIIVGQSRPMEIPKPEVHNHHRAPSNAGRRRRSPSFSRGTTQDFRRSEGDVRGYTPSSYVPPASIPVGGAPEAIYDESDTRRHFEKNARERAERARRQAEEEARMYGESPRRYDRGGFEDRPPPRRNDYQNDEDYYRAGGRGGGNGYDYAQPSGGPVYR